MTSPTASADEGLQTILVDPAVYPREAILRASYWLAPEAEIDITTADNGCFELSIRARNGQSTPSIVEKLRSALIDFSVRVDVENRTSDLRNRIWQTAFGEVLGGHSR